MGFLQACLRRTLPPFVRPYFQTHTAKPPIIERTHVAIVDLQDPLDHPSEIRSIDVAIAALTALGPEYVHVTYLPADLSQKERLDRFNQDSFLGKSDIRVLIDRQRKRMQKTNLPKSPFYESSFYWKELSNGIQHQLPRMNHVMIYLDTKTLHHTQPLDVATKLLSDRFSMWSKENLRFLVGRFLGERTPTFGKETSHPAPATSEMGDDKILMLSYFGEDTSILRKTSFHPAPVLSESPDRLSREISQIFDHVLNRSAAVTDGS